MKKTFFFALLAAALSCLCLFSCVKEDNKVPSDNNTEEEDDAISPEEIFWSVVGQLVDRNERTSDYKNKTFKPTIGDPDNGDESIRIVLVNDLGAAVNRYNTLVGANITDATASHNYSNPEVGQLTWTKSTDNKAWGTVEVDIQQVPSLRKIIYRSPEQGDANGGVYGGGSAYYRFGDVIQRNRPEDGQPEYWVCVRPAFDKEGKGKSHWVSVSPLPKSHVWPYNETGGPKVCSNGFDYGMPYNLGDDLEWHQDLAELLFAIMYPHRWATNLQTYFKKTAGVITGLRMFNDWDYKEYGTYHNEDFWNNVQGKWRSLGLVQKVFGVSYEEMAAALDPDVPGNGLHLLYKGYSWNTVTSNKPKLYEVCYSNSTTEGKQMNMHLVKKTTLQSQVVEPNKKTVSDKNFSMDFYQQMSLAKPYIKEKRYFGDDYPRWVVRYAEGAELAENGTENNQLELKGFDPDENGEVYRYYRDVFPQKHLTDGPEITQPGGGIVNDKSKWNLNAFAGDSNYDLGDVLKDENGHRWIVIKRSGGSEKENKYTDKSPYTELISFEGITYSNDNKVADNIITKDQLLRISHPLWALVQDIHKKWAYIQAGTTTRMSPVYNNIKEKAEVDLHTLMQHANSLPYNASNENQKGGSELCSIAFRQDGSIYQHLMRYILETDAVNEFITVMYDHYPKNKVTANTYPDLTSGDFSTDDIYLQDVANINKVEKYADDFFARQSITGANGALRLYRTAVEPKAELPSNYAYNNHNWVRDEQPLGMWNEPVLLIRATVLYDRGTEYSTKTIDGHTLTVVSRGGYDPGDPNGPESERFTVYQWYKECCEYNDAARRHINGVTSALPDWKDIWK